MRFILGVLAVLFVAAFAVAAVGSWALDIYGVSKSGLLGALAVMLTALWVGAMYMLGRD